MIRYYLWGIEMDLKRSVEILSSEGLDTTYEELK
mgnify:CR=1 FL=1